MVVVVFWFDFIVDYFIIVLFWVWLCFVFMMYFDLVGLVLVMV